MNYSIECIAADGNHLGESPIWDVEQGVLYWVDGTGRRVGNPSIWRLDPRTGKKQSWSLDQDVGALALRKNGGAVLALDDGFYFFDFTSGKLELIEKIDAAEPRSRLNDGKVDRRGRFLAGGMDDQEEQGLCGLWRLDPDLRTTKLDDGIICSNGPCWSPDDKTFYFADTFQQIMWAYDYDIEDGSISNKRDFASSAAEPGFYDGSTVDAEGCVWNAMVIGGELIRYAPDGTVERRIGMPVKNITSINFGGDRLDEIYVTSMARVSHPSTHDHFARQVKPQFERADCSVFAGSASVDSRNRASADEPAVTSELLLSALGAQSGIVCLVGAGGKKTAMYALAAAHPGRVLLSSTAHMYPYDEARVDCIIRVAHPDAPLADCADARVVAVCGASTTPHRVGGLPAGHIRRIYAEQHFDLCVIKADGARARWIKSPGAHEPLIPSFAQTVIPVVSAAVIGRPLDERIAHRPERLTELLGIAPGARITAEHLADLLSNPMGALKNVGRATVIPLINMVDNEELHALARQAARAALERSERISRIVLASMRSARIVEVIER